LLVLRCLSSAYAQQRIDVQLADGVQATHTGGRVLVVFAPENAREPRRLVGDTGMDAAPLFGVDAPDWSSESIARIDGSSAAFPLSSLRDLPAGAYQVQAYWRCNPDLLVLDALGNLQSAVQRVTWNPQAEGALTLQLQEPISQEDLPKDTQQVRFVKLRSARLSAFWGRDMYVRAAVLLPQGFEAEPTRTYPTLFEIGGYGSRCRGLARRYADGSRALRDWNAADMPRFVLVHLDGAGPLGDPYQVDSANHGPWGAALVEELIPHLERTYRLRASGQARFTTGHSTGGWVSLALQVHYPGVFNGCWSFAPDGVDFRHFQLMDVYKDANAYVNAAGFERPSMRTLDGDVAFTVRHECQLENVLGVGNSWALSGGQWGAWNATYGPRGADGLPSALWDPRTGVIDDELRTAWRTHDLRHQLQTNWKQLAPKLAGKLHVYVGDADNYFLNNAVARLKSFFDEAQPPFEGEIRFGWREGHGYHPLSLREVLQAAQARLPRD
jgi:S-formylglutathione hydrolase FrmB